MVSVSAAVMTKTLGGICDEVGGIIRTGPFGSQLHESDYSLDGIPVVMPKDIVDGRVIEDSIARIDEVTALRLAQHSLRAGDIVYGRRGDIGRRALITDRENGWLCGTGCLRISLGTSILDPLFLYYYLGQPDVVSWIANQAIGATLPNLNTAIIRSIEVTYPPLPTQRKIAAILSAYDDLIENNTRRIALVEEMARALYREWFVEFRYPGHEGVPLVESPLGPVPQGWRVMPVTDAIWVDPPTKVPSAGEKPFVPMGSLSNSSMVISAIETREGNSGSKFRNGDTLFARITPSIENGKTGFVQFLSAEDSVAFGSTEFIVLRSKSLCPEYVYLLARTDEFRDNGIKSMTGATGRQRVQPSSFERFLIAHPDEHTLSAFQEQAAPAFQLIHMLSERNDQLRRTRNLLLPKLVSGAVDVAGLEIEVGDV